MKLSMSMLALYLRSYEPESHIFKDIRTITGIRFLSDQYPRQSLDYVYLGPADRFFEDARLEGAWILANGQNQLLCRSADYEDLLNDVLSAFDWYGNLEQQLYIAASQHHPLSDMTDLIRDYLPSPLLVFDLEGHLLSASNMDKLKESPSGQPDLLANISQYRTLGSSTIGNIFVDREGNVSHDLTTQPQLLHPRSRPEEECVCLYLSRGEEHIGFVLCFPQTVEDVQPALALVPFIAGFLADCNEFSAASSPYQANQMILERLLTDEVLDPAVIQKFREKTKLQGALCLLLFQSHAIRNYTIRHMLLHELEISGIPNLGCVFEGHTVIVTRHQDVEIITDMIRHRMPSANLSLGISMPVPGAESLHAAFLQAQFALDASPDPGVRCCRDLALAFLLQSLKKEKMTGYLLHPAITTLTAYDEANNSDLCQTLFTYLENGCNQAETAACLNIHLNTLKYRLKRITEFTGITFRDRQENFYLHLSAKLFN